MTILDLEVTLCAMRETLAQLSDDELDSRLKRWSCYPLSLSLKTVADLDAKAEARERLRRKTMAKPPIDFRVALIDAAIDLDVCTRILAADRPADDKTVGRMAESVTRYRLLASVEEAA